MRTIKFRGMNRHTIPKYILKAIQRRANAARIYVNEDLIISEWCTRNGINAEYIYGNVETVTNYDVNEFIRDIYDNWE